MILKKDGPSFKMEALQTKLSDLLKSTKRWGMISLDNGFYEFTLSCLEDVRSVHIVSSWNLNLGFLRLFRWKPDFNHIENKQTTTQLWVRFLGLSQEYWIPEKIFVITIILGTFLSWIHPSMFDCCFGHYVRIPIIPQNLINKRVSGLNLVCEKPN